MMQISMVDGGWRMEDDGWRMEDDGWRMDDRGWRMNETFLTKISFDSHAERN